MARTDDPMYDGVGGNAVILVFGWLLAFIFQIPHIVIRLLVDLIAARRETTEQQAAMKSDVE